MYFTVSWFKRHWTATEYYTLACCTTVLEHYGGVYKNMKRLLQAKKGYFFCIRRGLGKPFLTAREPNPPPPACLFCQVRTMASRIVIMCDFWLSKFQANRTNNRAHTHESFTCGCSTPVIKCHQITSRTIKASVVQHICPTYDFFSFCSGQYMQWNAGSKIFYRHISRGNE